MTMVIKLQEKEGIKIARLAELSRFTQYIYKMQTTPNKVIINKL